MTILYMTEYGEGLPLAMHTPNSKMWIKNDINIGGGLVQESMDWLEDAKKSDLVILTSSNLHPFQKMVQKWAPTIGGSRFEYNLNKDPSLWKNLFKLGGGSDSSPPPLGEEIVLGAFYGKGGWRLPAVVGRIERGFLGGGKGLMVDGMGACVTSDVARTLFPILLEPIGQSLKRNDFVGFISMVASFDGGELHPVGIKAGLDSFLIPPTLELVGASLPAFLKRLIKHYPSSDLRPLFGMSVGISIPPYPYMGVEVHRVEVDGYGEHNAKHIWLLDVVKDNGIVECGGNSGALGYVSGNGTSLHRAKKRVERTLDGLDIPHLQYRGDVGEGFTKLIDKVNKVYHFMKPL